MLINKKGFSFIEIVSSMVILGLITWGVTSAVSGNIKRSKVSATATILQVFASDMDGILEGIGTLSIKSEATEISKRSKIYEYLTLIEANYTHTNFDRTTLVINSSNFEINTKEQLDGWDAPLMLTYNTDEKKGAVGICILSSAGPNLNFEKEGYSEGKFGDDILVMVQPKG